MRVLITGGSGFLGSVAARMCFDRGDRVHTIVRPTSDLDRLADIEATRHTADLIDTAAIRKIVGEINPDLVIHTAAHRDHALDEETRVRAWSETVRFLRPSIDHRGHPAQGHRVGLPTATNRE